MTTLTQTECALMIYLQLARNVLAFDLLGDGIPVGKPFDSDILVNHC